MSLGSTPVKICQLSWPMCFNFHPKQITLRMITSPSFYRQSCYFWHHKQSFIFVKMTIDGLSIRFSRYVILPIFSCFLYFGKRICGLNLCNTMIFVHYVAFTGLHCASFVIVHYSLVTYLAVDPSFPSTSEHVTDGVKPLLSLERIHFDLLSVQWKFIISFD